MIVYSDGSTNFTVDGYTSGSAIAVMPTMTTTYSIVSITDANNCSITPVSNVMVNTEICCLADAGDISNNSSTSSTLTACEGSDLLDGLTEIVFATDYTAGDEDDPGAGYETAFAVANANYII